MADKDMALMAHLMRRAGFGATIEELELRAARGYEATIEELLNPEKQPDNIPVDLLQKCFPDWVNMNNPNVNLPYWLYRMVNTNRPLEEKICLFWHCILCVGNSKCMHGRMIFLLLNKFRQNGLGNFRDLLVQLASDSAMI